jgi:hypothetical protein
LALCALDQTASVTENKRGQAMCAFIVDSVDLQNLTTRKKKSLKKELQRRKSALEAKIKHHQTTVRDLDKAIKKL